MDNQNVSNNMTQQHVAANDYVCGILYFLSV